MWKTRIKISKLLTNIHAGFVTALLGCVLTFGATPAMGSATVTTSYCTVTGTEGSGKYTEPCSGATQIGMSTAAMCNTAQVEHTCLRHTNGQTYYITACSCHSGTSGTSQTLSNTACGTITIAYPTCSSGSGDSECTVASDCGTSDTAYTDFGQTGYLKKTTYTCSNGTCGSSTSYTCALGYGGTASCTANKNVLTGITWYTCSGCEKTCSSDSECTYTYTTTQNFYYITVGHKCRTKSGTTYKTCDTKYTKSCGCIKGYYGEPYNNADTGVGCIGACTRCDIDPKTGIYGTTTGDGVGKEAKHCYIPSGEPFTDDIGSGRYSGACYDL